MKHINQEQRYQIAGLIKAGYSKSAIAKELGVHKCSIGRELKRNSDKRSYNGQRAQIYANERKSDKPKKGVFTSTMQSYIRDKLADKWSPEQIKGRCDKENTAMVSHECIYQYIWKDKSQGGNLWKHLRHGHKKYRKRYGSKDNRGQIPNKVSIEQRPEVVDKKQRIGDWEIDTIIGANHKGAILTATERKTQYILMAKIKSKSHKDATSQIVNLLAPFKEMVLTITSDNGLEFYQHQYIAKKLKADYYFAHPFSSWERGLNEYQNKLIRQYIPKKSNFDAVGNSQILYYQQQLNQRPRKKLGFFTPNELLFNKKLHL